MIDCFISAARGIATTTGCAVVLWSQAFQACAYWYRYSHGLHPWFPRIQAFQACLIKTKKN